MSASVAGLYRSAEDVGFAARLTEAWHHFAPNLSGPNFPALWTCFTSVDSVLASAGPAAPVEAAVPS